MTGFRWQRWTIGRELALLVLATLLPFAVLGGYWAGQDYRAEQGRIQARALRLARTVSAEVDQFVNDTAALVEAMARVPSVKRGEEPQSSQLLAELVQRYPFYESLFVAASDGRVLASGGADVPPPGNRQSYIQETLRSGMTLITDPIAPRTPRGTARHVFVVATPVWDESGKPLGIVAASVNLLRLEEALRRADLPDNSSVIVVDKVGRIVTRRTEPEDWVGKSALGSSAVRNALRLREGVSEGDFVDGVRRLSGFSEATRVPWIVIAGIPMDEAYGALRRELVRAVARLVLVGAVAALVAWVFSRRLTAPIRRLAAAADAYASGDLSVRARTSGPEELAALGTTLNGMASALQTQLAELREARQRERDAGERALAELRRLHSEFIAVAAHELRTPVAAAKNYAELLVRDDVEWPSATRRQALQRLDAVCDRLARLVRSLLGASRIQAGRLVVHCEPVDLASITTRVCQEMQAQTASHPIRVAGNGQEGARWDGGDDQDDQNDASQREDDAGQAAGAGRVMILGDAERIEDVLVNLLSNATKYSPDGSPIDVGVNADESGDFVEVQVADRGPGIPQDEQEAVFERFRRGRSVAASGVGLGLYNAQAYIQAMGGEIGGRSAVGRGATFWFRLRRAEPAARAAGDGSGTSRYAEPAAATPVLSPAAEETGAAGHRQRVEAA
jgi:signal transduction histidine kinase